MVRIDLNSDLGESFGAWSLGDDEAMLAVVTSANVACGFHAGDPIDAAGDVSPRRPTAAWRSAPRCRIPTSSGSAAGYIDMAPSELRDAVLYQLGALDAFAQVAGSRIAYVKPHGALYHAVATERRYAEAVVAAVVEYDPSLGDPRPAGVGAAPGGRCGRVRSGARSVRRPGLPARRRPRLTAGAAAAC